MRTDEQPDQGPMSPLPGQCHQEGIIALPDGVHSEIGQRDGQLVRGHLSAERNSRAGRICGPGALIGAVTDRPPRKARA